MIGIEEIEDVISEEKRKCKESFEYFFKNYIKIQGEPAKWHDHYKHIESSIEYSGNKSHTDYWPRQSGKTTYIVARCLWEVMFLEKETMFFSVNLSMLDHSRRYFMEMYYDFPSWMRDSIRIIESNRKYIRFSDGRSIRFETYSNLKNLEFSLRGSMLKEDVFLFCDEFGFSGIRWEEFITRIRSILSYRNKINTSIRHFALSSYSGF